MHYEEWMIQVDRVVQKITGVRMDELPDWLSRDAFEDGLTPTVFSDDCMIQIGFFDDELFYELCKSICRKS